MSYPSAENFQTLLLNTPLDHLVRDYLFTGVPFIFRDKPSSLILLVDHLAKRLKVNSDNIRLVGSAKLGYSLAPHKYARRFSNASDFDVIIVDERLFDLFWFTTLAWHYPRYYSGALPYPDSDWVGKRRKDVYWGWVDPNEIAYDGAFRPEALKPLTRLTAEWKDAFDSLALIREFARRKIEGRLYRTWQHAIMYHTNSLAVLRESLMPANKIFGETTP